MKFRETELPGVIVVQPRVFRDERGFFLETYHAEKYAEGGIPHHFVQDNHSRSTQGILRGLHLQRGEHAQGKLVRCTQGRILDVAVDIRVGSPTFRQHVAVELTDTNYEMLWVPADFAHGFLVLSETAEVQYKCTKPYHPESELSLRYDDPDLAVAWPEMEVTLSAKDEAAPRLLEVMDQLPQWRG